MHKVVFMGSSLRWIRGLPADVKQDIGFQLDRIQRGENPDDWKPMQNIAMGAREIRIRSQNGQYRVIYWVNQKNALFVLHVFMKKSQKTRKADIDLARKRFEMIGKQNA